jgi:3'(2'), 5'-bisphosphate nucleotidase
MLDLTQPEIRFAIDTVHAATLLVQRVQTALVTASLTKEDRSPVTVGDFAAQALVGRRLQAAFPADPLVAEEDSQTLRADPVALGLVTRFLDDPAASATSAQVCTWIDRGGSQGGDRFWTLDPIDGTKGFLRGDQYAVALALVVDGQVQVGALGCPYLSDGYRPDLEGSGSLAVAARGQGTWVASLDGLDTWERLHVSGRDDPGAARLFRSFEAGHTNVGQIDAFAAALGIESEPVRMDSQAKYVVLAAGKGDLLLRLLSPAKPDYREKIWDQAAGSIILEEAGGRITDLDGQSLDFTTGRSLTHNRGILATNGALHPAALAALRRIGA